jgi:beta-lactamase class A
VKLQVIDLVVNSKAKLPASITITKDVLGEGEEAMLGKSYSVEQLVSMTLKDSSNVATNALIKAIAGEGGEGTINPAIQSLLRDRGYGNTNLTNYLNTTLVSAQGKNTSTTNDVTKAMGNLIQYDGPLKQVIRDSLGTSDTPFQGNRIVDGIPVIYNKIGGTTTAANTAVIEVNGSKYIITTTKGGVDGTSGQGDAISDAALREAIKQIKGLGNMGGPSNATPTVNIKGGLQSI